MIRPIRDYTTHSLCVLYLCCALPEEFFFSFYSERNKPVLQTAASKTAAFSQVNYLKACRHWSLITDCDLGILVVLSFFLLYTEASERVRELGYTSVLAQYTPRLSFAFPSRAYRFRHAASWVCKSDWTHNNAFFFKTNVSGAGSTAFLQCHSEIHQGLTLTSSQSK